MNIIQTSDKFPLDLTTAEDRTFQKLHLSTIYTDIEKKLFGGPRETNNPLWAQTGFLWERALADAFQREHPYIIRPGEVELDGIVGSPDGIDLKDNILEEYKCTWLSTKNASPGQVWKWITQTKGYCKMLGLKECRFRIWYINGDYGKNFGPQYKEFLAQYTQSELDENWDMITSHAKDMKWL